MSDLELIPQHLAALSISPQEIVLPMEASLDAIDYLEANGRHILGWEGWVKTLDGRVGHGSAPQGTESLENLSRSEAAALCRKTILEEAATWRTQNPGSKELLHFCITVRS